MSALLQSDPVAGPHARAALTVGGIMGRVMLALVPATAFGFWLFGWPAVYIWTVTLVSALAFEAGCLLLARRPLSYLGDGSVLLTAWLLALSLPPWAPAWLGVLGAFVAVVIGKQVFGGLGQNPFNPAMVARVVLLVSFPVEMTAFVEPGTALDPLGGFQVLLGQWPADALTGATPLGHLKTELTRGETVATVLADYSHWHWLTGSTGGSLGETSALLLAAGGLWLVWLRIIPWITPLALLATLALLAGGMHGLNPGTYPGPLFHLLSGGTMLGAFFIATDPVTSPVTWLGRLLFGVGCGLLIYAIRTWGNYPEGLGFAILLMNAATPLIDHYVRPRIFGRNWRGRPLKIRKG